MRVLGVDLAWGEGSGGSRLANETGVVAADLDGTVVDAGWTVGVEATLNWVQGAAAADTLLMVDAPLVVDNAAGQRTCERQVGQRYGRWKVSANSTNLGSPRQAGVALRQRLEVLGWRYDDGHGGPPKGGRVISECYPYTTLVGAEALGYHQERPTYKRRPSGIPLAAWRPLRAAVCDDLVQRLRGLDQVDPPMRVDTYPVTRQLVTERSPVADRDYKHREDLIDALLAAWTGLLWLRHGFAACQVLGGPRVDGLAATIIAPARRRQRA